MKRKSIIAILFNVIAGIYFTLISSCIHKSSDSIRIGILDGPSAISFIQMIDHPPVIAGKKVEIIIKSEPLQIQALMMQGELDFAILPTVMAANLYNKGLKYRMLACPIWGTLYLLKNDSSILDLTGKTISVFGQGGTSDILLRRIIKQKKIANVNIDYSYATNYEISEALLHKKIKLAVVSEPLVSNLLAKDSSVQIVMKIDCEEYMDNSGKDVFVQSSFLVSESFTIKNPSIVEQVCEAYSNSCNFTIEQPHRTAKLMVKHQFSHNTAIAERSISLCNIRYVSAFAIEKEMNRYLNIFYKYNPKSVGGKMPNNDFIFEPY